MDLLLGEFTRDQMVAINYHVNIPSADPFSNSFTSARKSYYGVTGTPHNRIDGAKYSGSYSDITVDADRYRTKINTDLKIPPEIQLTITGRLDATEGFVLVTADVVEPIAETDLVIHFGVVEDHVSYSTRDLRYVLRTMPVDEEVFINSIGETARTARFFSYDPSWDSNNMRVVAFVQSVSTKKVYQSIFYDGADTVTVSPIPITANWASGTMPTIDGKFGPGEWSMAKETFVDLSYYVNFPYYVYTMNDDNYLYVCVDAVGDTISTGYHYSGIYFDTQEDGVLNTSEEDAVEIRPGNTFYKVWDGSAWVDKASSPLGVPFPPGSSDEAGLTGAYTYGSSDRESANHFVYEYKIPLVLGSINASPGDAKKAYIYLWSRGEESYWSNHTKWSDPTTYGDLTLASSASVPVNTPLLAAILLVILGIITAYTLRSIIAK